MCKQFNYLWCILGVGIVFWQQAVAMGSKPKAPPVMITTTAPKQPKGPIQFCPLPDAMVKKDGKWLTKNGKWRSYTPSTATKVSGFLGAQWVGIKVGKIICLYKTNETVEFPLALEQKHSDSILEPSNYGWSALANNRKFCKSANVADCAYFAQPQQDITNIYKEIEYNPSNPD